MSFENPSAAFLAGQQHGAALAVQHHAAATKPVGPKPKPAAPTKPAVSKPGGTAGDTLLAQAQKLAQQQTQSIVNAILAQQKVYSGQGQQQATDINNAAQAAANLLQNWNLPGATSSSYTDAAKALGALAQGFSGQTQTDATNAANAVQANLANLGAPAGGLKTATGQTVDPAAMGNVLYGLGGFIPGNLLETSGQAAAAQQRTLPLNLLAGAQDKAAGAIQAANDKAATLTPQILDAQGKLPQLASQVYNDMFNQKVALQKLADSEQATKFDQSYKTHSFNATQAYRQVLISLKKQGLVLQQQKQQDAVNAAIAKGARPSAALSKLYGHIVDANGNAVTDPAGKVIPVTSTSGSKALSAAKINQLSGDAAMIAKNTLHGFKDTKNVVHPPLSFGNALQEMRQGAGHGQIPLPIALSQMRQAGWKIPAKYNKILGEVGQQANPFPGSAPAADWRVATGPEGAGGVWHPSWNQTLSPVQRADVARQALEFVDPRLASPANVSALVGRMNQESGGQTAVVNKWDSNWQNGVPSVGLLQVIGPTFDSYKAPGHTNIWDPLDNAIAAVRYMLANYGRIVGPSSTGY